MIEDRFPDEPNGEPVTVRLRYVPSSTGSFLQFLSSPTTPLPQASLPIQAGVFFKRHCCIPEKLEAANPLPGLLPNLFYKELFQM